MVEVEIDGVGIVELDDSFNELSTEDKQELFDIIQGDGTDG